MLVTLLGFTPSPDEAVAVAARLCYSGDTVAGIARGVGNGSPQSFIQSLVKKGHMTPLEHASFTFGIEGISRACSHQLVRHRIASYCQRSQRYVELRAAEKEYYVIPQSVMDNPAAATLYRQKMDELQMAYRELIDRGVAKEDARYVLPNAAQTSLVVTMNARALYNFFKLRCCHRAQWEIQAVAVAMLAEVKGVAPAVFSLAGPGCLFGKCPEGAATCGRPFKMEACNKTATA